MKWKKLTKDVFPDIMKDEYIISNTTDGKERHIEYESKDFIYLIAIDTRHEPSRYRGHGIMVDDTHLICGFHARHIVDINTKTGEIIDEEKKFYCNDSTWLNLSINWLALDAENLEYCRYTIVKAQDITDCITDKCSDN